MRKRAIAVLLSAAMMACSITGCGGNSGKETEAPAATQQEAATEKGTENTETKAEAAEAGGESEITGKTEFANDKLLRCV